jgi:dihydrofolate reductase
VTGSSPSDGAPVITIVVAVADNGVIGDGEGMPWHLPEDLKRLKAMTMGKPLIMGRKTYSSIGRPLPGRLNIVLSRDQEFAPEGVTVARNFEDALEAARRETARTGAGEIIIFGGAKIYELAWDLVTRMYITEVHVLPTGAVRFPRINPAQWRQTARESHLGDENAPSHDFVTLERIHPSS